MHVLFIIDPLPGLKAYKDSSVAMMRALVARGHRLSFALQEDLYIRDGLVGARTTDIALVPGADLHAWGWCQSVSKPEDRPLKTFGAVLMRKDPPFDMEYLYATHLLDYAQAQGARVFNAGEAIRNHPEKLAISEFTQFTAPTLVSRCMDRLKAFHAEQGELIVKPLDGMGGAGIFRLSAQEPNRNAIFETLTEQGRRTIMAQRYIPEISQGDKRILLIGGEPVPYALARVPQAGETRGNLAAGGRGIAQSLSVHDRTIAETIAPVLSARGLLLVGLDVIGNYLTEINVTSPTCFVEITEQTGFDVAGMFVEALERAVGQGAGQRAGA